MKPGLLLLAAVATAGCARIEPPPGGPEDRDPPRLVVTRPDSLAVLPSFRGAVVFAFDERISERGVDEAVSVSPRTSPVAVDHSGDEIRVSLRRGWEAGRIYQVRVQPTIQDLFGNALAAPLEVVFSTGGAIPETRASGTVSDRITGRAEVGVRVEAIREADSLVYSTRTDSTGAWVLARFPEGRYRFRAFADANQNRELDPFEARDTAAATVAARQGGEAIGFALLLPDSTPPAVANAQPLPAGAEVRFDDYLLPEQGVSAAQVRLTGPGEQAVAVAAVRVGSEAPTSTGPTPPDTLRADSAAAPPRPVAPDLPSRSLFLSTAAPLAPDTPYRVRVTGVRNVNGLPGGGETEFRTPPARPTTQP